MSRILNIYNPISRRYLSYIAPSWCRLNNRFITETEIFINTILNINDSAKEELNQIFNEDNIFKTNPNIPYMAYITPYANIEDETSLLTATKVANEAEFLRGIPSSLNVYKEYSPAKAFIKNIDVDTTTNTPRLYAIYNNSITEYNYDNISTTKTSPIDVIGTETINKSYEYNITITDELLHDEIYLLPDYIVTFLTYPTIGKIYKSTTDGYDSRFDINNDGIFWYDDLDEIISYIGIDNTAPDWDEYYKAFDIFNKGILTEEIIDYFRGLLGSTFKVSNVLVVPTGTKNVTISFRYMTTEKCIKKSTANLYYYSNDFQDIVNYERLGIKFALLNGILYYSSIDTDEYIIAPLPLGTKGCQCIKIFNDYLFLLRNSVIEAYNLLNKSFPSMPDYSINVNTNISSFAIDNDGSFILCDGSTLYFTRYLFNRYYMTDIDGVNCCVSSFEINQYSSPVRLWNIFTIAAYNSGIYYDYPFEDNFQLRSRLNTIYNLERNDSIRFIESIIMIDCGVENVVSMPDNMIFTFPFVPSSNYAITAKTDTGFNISSDNIIINSNTVIVKTDDLTDVEFSTISFICVDSETLNRAEVSFSFPYEFSKQYIRFDHDIERLNITENDIYTWKDANFNSMLLKADIMESGTGVYEPHWSSSSYFTKTDDIISGRIYGGLELVSIRNIQMEDIIIDNNILDFDENNELHQSLLSLSGSKYFNWIPKISDGIFIGRNDNETYLYAYFNRYKAVKITTDNMTLSDDGEYFKYLLDPHYDDKYIIIISLTDIPTENLFKVDSRNYIYDPIENVILIPKIHVNKFVIYNSSINSKSNFVTLNIHPFYNNLTNYFLAFSTNETEETGGQVGGLLQIETQYDYTNGATIAIILLVRDNKNQPVSNIPVEISMNRIYQDSTNRTINVDYNESKITMGGFDRITFTHDNVGEIYETTDNNDYRYKIYDNTNTTNYLNPVMSRTTVMSKNLFMNSIIKKARKHGTYRLFTLNRGGLKYERNSLITFKFNAITDSMGKIYFEYIPPTFNLLENYVVIKATNLSNDTHVYKTIKLLPYEQSTDYYRNLVVYPSKNNICENETRIITLSSEINTFTIHVPYNINNLNSLFLISTEDYYNIYINKAYDTIIDKAISYSITNISFHQITGNIANSYYSITLRTNETLSAGSYIIIYDKIAYFNAMENSSNFIV